MKRYLVDSDFLVAVFREEDQNHQAAMGKLQVVQGFEVELWISNLVRQESATVVSHRVGMQAVKEFMKLLAMDIHRTVWVDKKLEERSWEIFLKQTKKKSSFVDSSNLAVIEKFKLDGILAFDGFYPEKLMVQ
ncbi:MAG: PIN domain-containing protein [Nanoarchaeota archaeon]